MAYKISKISSLLFYISKNVVEIEYIKLKINLQEILFLIFSNL